MAEKIVAIFVACSLDLLICNDLPFIRNKHIFSNIDKCRTVVAETVVRETEYRKRYGFPYPIVMGKCRWWLDEEDK